MFFISKPSDFIMYSYLLPLHSVFRWLVLISLLYSIYLSFRGKKGQLPFTGRTNHIRHWTATIAHIQLIIGILLYTKSPIVKYFLENGFEVWNDTVFYGLIHIILMLSAIVIITIGSAKAKRKKTDLEKFRTMFNFFSVALLIIFIVIPWPFSPLANRPYLRPF